MIGQKNLRIACLWVLLLAHLAHGLRTEHIGPMKEDRRPPGELKGLTALQYHPARVYSISGDWGQIIYFQADIQQVNQLLKHFAEIDMDNSEYLVWIPSEKKYTEKIMEMDKFDVRIASGTGKVKSYRDHIFEYNVALRVLGRFALEYYKRPLRKKPSSDKTILPRMTIHLGHKQFKWSDLQLPANVRLKDDRDIKIIHRKRRSEIKPFALGKVIDINHFYPVAINEQGHLAYPLALETVQFKQEGENLLCQLTCTEETTADVRFRVSVELLGNQDPLHKEVQISIRRILKGVAKRYVGKSYDLDFGPLVKLKDIKNFSTTIERIEPWGKTLDGVRVRLTAQKNLFTESEPTTFNADIQNQGARKFLIAQHESYFEVAIDGKWFRWTGDLGLKSSPFGPGRQYDQIPLKLDPTHWVSLSDKQPLLLSTGRHQVQSRLLLHDPDQAKVIAQVESNPVFIWIKKPFLFERMLYHGRVVFEDGTPGVMPTRGRIQTHIALCHEGAKQGKYLARAEKDGYFVAPLTDEEMTKVKEGASFLTVNVVNTMSRIKYDKTDTRFPVKFLTLEKEQAGIVTIQPLPKFYGRVLFRDEKPAVLDILPWSGARIRVELFGGQVPDEQGYITVYLNKEQQQQLKDGKLDRKGNIYCPNQKRGHSTSIGKFPANLLSLDKAKAGVVHITRPKYNLKPDLAKAPP